MNLLDRERVDGTRVTIGRRVQNRRIVPPGEASGANGLSSGNGGAATAVTAKRSALRVRSASATYTAVYLDLDGRRREEGLGTTNKREARRKAIEISYRLEEGRPREVVRRVEIAEVISRYEEFIKAANLAPKSLAKYTADLAKLSVFVADAKVVYADQFDEHLFYRYRSWLQGRTHKQGVAYSSKSVYTALTLAKQAFKHAWKKKLLHEYLLASAKLPKAKAKPQPCFTSQQVESVLTHLAGDARAAVTILAYSGMRVGELIQLAWKDVQLPKDRLGMFHIRRGGSGDTTKDKDERFVPVHPRVRPALDALPRSSDRVLPGVRDRWLLSQVKAACKAAGLGGAFKVHSLRHHFASMCANHSVAYRKALAWLGHSSSDILELYYHLHDDESEASMRALAGDHFAGAHDEQQSEKTEKTAAAQGASRGAHRRTQGLETETPQPQTPVDTAVAEGGSTEAERGGFEPPIQT